jgi:hypothetical protein
MDAFWEGAMDILTIVAVGLIATGYMFGVQWVVERLGLVRGSMLRAVGSFAIPEPVRSPAAGIVLHLVAGLVFTAVYAYIFHFVHMRSTATYLELGGLIGLVHGFFVSYFSMMGFSSFERGDQVKPFTFQSAVLNVVAHFVFGLLVGLGFAYASTGNVGWYFAYAAVIGLVIFGLFMLLVPRRQRLRHRHATARGP